MNWLAMLLMMAGTPGSADITDVPHVLEPDQDLSITVSYTNPGSEPVQLSQMELYAQWNTAVTATSVHAWMAGDTLAQHLTDIKVDEEVGAGESIDVQLNIPRDELPWESGEFTWGPRGIEVRAVSDDGVASDRTMIVATAEHITPFPAAVVVPERPPLHREPINKLFEREPIAVSDPIPGNVKLPPHDADIAALTSKPALAPKGDGVFLPAGDPNLETLALAADLGYTLVIPDTVYPPAEQLTYTPGPLTTIGLPEQTPAVVSHTPISSALAGEFVVGERDPIALDGLDQRQVVTALTAVHQRQRPNDPRPLVAVVDREHRMNLPDVPWVEPVGLAEILAGEPGVERTFLPGKEPRNMLSAEDFQRIEEGLAAFDQLATVFDDGTHLSEQAHEIARELTSVLWRYDPAERSRLIANIAPTEAQMSAIAVNTTSTINMISESSELPVPVRNDFTEPVNVVVKVDTPDHRLVAPEPVEVRLPASQTTTVSIPVEANGSGNIDAEVTVTNAAGQLVGTPDSLHVRVRADWETVGTAVIAAVVGGVFVFGLVRSIREGRRSEPIEPDDFVAASKR